MSENVSISDSILFSVKKLLGLNEDDPSFDVDIMININAASSTLLQLGVINKSFTVTSGDDTYDDLIPGGTEDIVNMVKMYFFLKTKLGFDSTTLNTSVIEVMKEMIKEYEWRLKEVHNILDG